MKKIDLINIIHEEMQLMLSENIASDAENFVATINRKYEGKREYVLVKGGSKFYKILQKSKYDTDFSSVWGFIAIQDQDNKDIKVGDLMKAASWKAPAKHSRGNILNNTAQYDIYGPDYLR